MKRKRSGLPNISWDRDTIKLSKKALKVSSSIEEALGILSVDLGREVTESSLRGAYVKNNLPSPTSFLTNEEIDEIEEDLDPIQHRVSQEEVSKDKKIIKKLVDEVREHRARQSFLDSISSFKAPPRIISREKNSKLRELTAVVLASDWHVEEPVEAASVAHRNEYDLEIAEQRIKRFFRGIVWNIEHQRASKQLVINDLVLWLGGDLMTGYIHPELVESNLLSPTETMIWLMPKLRDGIHTLLSQLDLAHIEIPCSYGNHGRCHDTKTELLTANGWKKYDEIEVGDMVATYNMASGATDWQPLLDVYIKEYQGPMIKVNTVTADFMVTPHHRMVVSTHDKPDEIIEMQEFVSRETMGSYNWPKCADGHNTDYIGVSDDELKLLGLIMTDGSIATTKQGAKAVRVYQSKEHVIPEIKELLDRMNLEYGTHVRTREAPEILGVQVKSVRPDTTFNVSVKSSQRFIELIPNKRQVPEWMQKLSKRQFNVFLGGLLLGDGHVRDGERVIYGDIDVISSIQTLAVVNGIAARVRIDNRGNGILSLPKSIRGWINDWEKSVKTVDYSGIIWCGTVENGTLITRRNGIPLISGNTTDKPRISTGYSNSFEWLMYHQLAELFKGEKRIHFEITPSPHQYVSVYNKVLHFHHGDDVKYMGGVGGLGIPLLKAIPMWDLVKRADIHNIGHHHSLRDYGRAVVNGSLIGYGPYSQRIRAEFENPGQMMYYVDSLRGKCMVTHLWVDSDDDYQSHEQHSDIH